MATKDINLMLCITVGIAILKHKSKCNIRLICLIVTARWPWHNNKISDRSQVDTVQCLHDGVEIHRDIISRPQSRHNTHNVDNTLNNNKYAALRRSSARILTSSHGASGSSGREAHARNNWDGGGG